jgi:hypothetical protein
LNIDNPDYQNKLWLEAIALRVDDMLTSHPEIDSDSRALLVDAVIAGLIAHPKKLDAWKNSNSFIESSFFDDEDQDNTKLSGNTIRNTKTSHVLPNGVCYSISKPIFNSKRGKKNGKS